MRAALVGLAVALLCGACTASTTSPSTTSTTTTTTSTASAPTSTDTFAGTLPVGGAVSFPFTVGVYGTVNVTLLDVSGTRVPSTVQLKLGIGTPDDSGACVLSLTATAKAGSAAQLTGTEQPGSYCVSVSDVGNLFNTAAFDVSVAHP